MMSNSHPHQSKGMTRRSFLRAVGTAGASAVLAACGGTSTTGAPGTGAGKEPITISLWTHDNLYAKFFTARGEEWKQTKPEYDITFNFQQVPDVFTKVLANLAAQIEVPDLLGIEQGAFPQFMQDGIIAEKFVNLTPRLGDEINDLVPGSLTKYTYQGNLYGIESGLCASVLYYQPALLEKAGVDVPQTWEDAIPVGEALAKQGTSFLALDGGSWGIFTELFWQHKGSFFDKDSNMVFNTPENRQISLEVLDFLRTGLEKNFLKPFSSSDFWAPPIYASYKDGSVAGIVMPDWYSEAELKASLPDMAGQWRIAKMPLWKNNSLSTSTWGGTGFAISKSSKNVDLVWDLLHYTYVTKESQIKRYEELKYFPTMKSALQDPRIKGVTDEFYGGQQIGEVFVEIAPDVPEWYQSPARGPLLDALNVELNHFYGNQITAEQTIDAVVASTKRNAQYL
jgi:ABC-type glycerol-3-phosphate transport system substrate-binding protein